MVIVPEALPEGSKLKALAEWADTKEVVGQTILGKNIERRRCDLILSEEAVKVGAYNVTDITQKTANVNDKESLLKALEKATIHKIPYSGYKIQGGVNNKVYHETLYQTQGRKIWYNGINYERDYSYYANGFEVTLADGTVTKLDNGDKLVRFYNDLLCANLKQSLKDVKK